MKRLQLFILLAVFSIALNAKDEINMKALDGNGYEVELLSDRELSIAGAQEILVPSAIAACDGLVPSFGKYKFESSMPIAEASKDSTSFRFVQEVSCKAAASIAEKARPRTLGEEERNRIAFELNEATEDHFKALSTERFRDAYRLLSEYLQGVLTFDKWSNQERQFNLEAGRIVSGGVWNVTVYLDPPSAPQPGFYVATDFQFEYESVAFRCGFLVWYSKRGVEYRIIRQEDGKLPRAMLDELSESQLQQVKTQLRCGAA